tara:strand:+ start:31504 stop:32211 length:708 start_codon:yes stop_codon:yes gene_type:complete
MGHILPRNSFVKLSKLLTVSYCDPVKKLCVTKKFGSSASGVVIKKNSKGVFILTAGHVCSNNFLQQFKNMRHSLEFTAIDIQGNHHAVQTISINTRYDLCMLWSKDFIAPAAVMSQTAPVIGDKVYNLAAPAGIFSRNMIPILEGYFSGFYGKSAIFSIMATGGSSGSPVFNNKGQVVGMIHSVFVRFPALALGAQHGILKEFVESTVAEYEKKLFFNQVLTILTVMTSMFTVGP